MKKAELIEHAATRAHLGRREVTCALDAALNVITEALARGEDVSLTGFGKFTLSERSARRGVNPRTGEPIDVPATPVAGFVAGSRLKKAVRG